ncbi:biopolymer transport protein ExbD [Tamilnaduibacter salinus]|uniref:Biopolymer transport protein ExbD n=1 Tax=Tamilnaduibacter salinus TaxID=1484056 RepID=A0A2U1CZR0_9GAMM|nr:biopolymer transporter ExbD [Tamilnaduibacter salinus]PVY78280.1 biopolymer transport protein ExbD [Tamilnaduibacter salinus]
MRRRHRRLQGNPDLDITAFLNLMIILVPVLLLGMVFTQVRMIELDFPGMPAGEAPEPEAFQLEVVLTPSGMEVADSERGLIRAFPNVDGQDFDGVQSLLAQIKQRMPEKRDLILRVAPSVDYQTLVTTMDHVRSRPAVVVASKVEAELFPDVSLADAPEGYEVQLAEQGGQP